MICLESQNAFANRSQAKQWALLLLGTVLILMWSYSHCRWQYQIELK